MIIAGRRALELSNQEEKKGLKNLKMLHTLMENSKIKDKSYSINSSMRIVR